MAHVIAVAGKGGVGKTTLCGMLIQYLCEKKKGPVLAVDADANSNLNEVLGVEVCYCFVNGLLQAQLAKYQKNYPYIVVDNEAGMEHISRGILPSMETAILVSDCSRRGVQAVGRIAELIKECDMKPSRVGLIINRAPKAELNSGILEEIRNQGLDLIGVVPQDEAVYEYDCDGKPTVTLPEDNPMRKAAFEIFDKLGL